MNIQHKPKRIRAESMCVSFIITFIALSNGLGASQLLFLQLRALARRKR